MRSNTTTKLPKSAAKKSTSKSGAASGKTKKTICGGSKRQPPLKVVHISNPMRVEVTPAEFRDLVQDLTGRHAAEWPDHPRWNHNCNNNNNNNTNKKVGGGGGDIIIPDFALDRNGNNQQDPAGRGGGTHEAEGLDVIEHDIGYCFGSSDLSYDDDHDQMLLVNMDDVVFPY